MAACVFARWEERDMLEFDANNNKKFDYETQNTYSIY
jgi:hypothetical protein